MAKGQAGRQREAVIACLKNSRGPVALGEIARTVGVTPEQLKTLLGQLKGRVRCISKAHMDSEKSMSWFHVDSRWELDT